MEHTRRHLLIVEAERLRGEGVELDEILRRLRERGFSKAQSVALLAGLREFGWDNRLARAKEIVHESPVWADAKERDDKILDELDN
jgi:hypothetical protein